MAGTVTEQLRSCHEEIEAVEKAVALLLVERDKKPKERVRYEHAIRDLLFHLQEQAQLCLDAYADIDGLRRDEIAFLAGQSKRGSGRATDVWMNFYDQIKSVKDFYKKQDSTTATLQIRTDRTIADEALQTTDVEFNFTADEQLGRHVDMSEHFTRALNLQKWRQHRIAEHKRTEISRMKQRKLTDEEIEERMTDFVDFDLLDYLKSFDNFRAIPRHCKYREKEYEEYLIALSDYLRDSFVKANPLADSATLHQSFEDDFERRWETKEIDEWKVPTYSFPFYSRAVDALFASEGTFMSHKKGKKFHRAMEMLMTKTMAEQKALAEQSREHDKRLAHLEALTQRYRECLGDTIERTIAHIRTKQSRSARELEEEAEAEAEEEEKDVEGVGGGDGSDVSEGDDEEDKPVYNPLNLPLGWDGKPIPFWLYKLHGLGQEFKCEICGNYSYWGRRAFERHFQEWRHAFGMRCLKIPNTVHFKEVTKIEDAITLYEKLKKEADLHMFRADAEVECEDSLGNVMNSRAYEDLRRQGLL